VSLELIISPTESLLIRAGSRALIEPNRVYASLYHLIIKHNFVFISSSFNNRFEYELSLFKPISSKLTSISARLHPLLHVRPHRKIPTYNNNHNLKPKLKATILCPPNANANTSWKFIFTMTRITKLG
jgi:hypothetical protein